MLCLSTSITLGGGVGNLQGFDEKNINFGKTPKNNEGFTLFKPFENHPPSQWCTRHVMLRKAML